MKNNELVIVKQNKITKFINRIKCMFSKNRIEKEQLIKKINLLENELAELENNNDNSRAIHVSIYTTKNRIAILKHKLTLK